MAKILSIIVAVADDYGIGNKNELLIHISADLKRFKELTSGKTVVMGRNTWFSLPRRPLPNRKNIVITNNPEETFEGAETVYSIEEAISKCPENTESFIMGGAMVYKQFFEIADKLHITHVLETFDADTFFPRIEKKDWKVVLEGQELLDEKTGVKYKYVDYIRE